MAMYCTLQEIKDQALPAGEDYNDTDMPTEDQVTSYGTLIYNEINEELAGAGITVPVTVGDSPNAYALLGNLNAIGAMCHSLMVTFIVKGIDPPQWLKDWKKINFTDRLEKYTGNPKRLIDAQGAVSPGYCYNNMTDIIEAEDFSSGNLYNNPYQDLYTADDT